MQRSRLPAGGRNCRTECDCLESGTTLPQPSQNISQKFFAHEPRREKHAAREEPQAPLGGRVRGATLYSRGRPPDRTCGRSGSVIGRARSRVRRATRAAMMSRPTSSCQYPPEFPRRPDAHQCNIIATVRSRSRFSPTFFGTDARPSHRARVQVPVRRCGKSTSSPRRTNTRKWGTSR